MSMSEFNQNVIWRRVLLRHDYVLQVDINITPGTHASEEAGTCRMFCYKCYTVKPLLNRHPRDLSKCPLNGGCPLNRGLL